MNKQALVKVLNEKRAKMRMYERNISSGRWKYESVRGLMQRLQTQIDFFALEI